ncbi:MAG: putative permease [Candidatus Magasanikbacteria bacterium GW2011_GWC2_37_14]|uniref:Putative permease n=1 Tax=Candidatus Magasanikbacteria bacterium GW2011_GWC2_37_14 TaxID=1619046 RepID=A0A0G0JFM9_9BACT|nr:MAG: putative permease [Candidatus Magasanikbacteria bacterium GW2011_GWC2_37_14]
MPTNTNFIKMRSVFFFSLIIILGIILLYIFRPFFYPIFWAAIIAITFNPLYKKIHHFLKWPILSSIISLVLVFIILFIPLILLSTLVVNESVGLYEQASSGNWIGQVKNASHWFDNTPFASLSNQIEANWSKYAESAAKNVSLFLFDNIKSITQNSVRFIFLLFIMFYSLFFFFKDGGRILKKIMHLSPLGDIYEEMLCHRFTSTARATLKGTFIVGTIQGILGGILFWIVGIKGALIWGVIMTALSIVPGVGCSIVWFPTAIIMLILGNTWEGLTMLVVGMLIISTIDNLLRPVLVGKDSQMHPLIVLLSTLGGIFMFGISGFVIGPVFCALFLAVINIYEHHYRMDLNKN